MVGELPHQGDDVGVLEEDQPPVAVVIRERAERLRPQRHIGMQRQGPIEARRRDRGVDQ